MPESVTVPLASPVHLPRQMTGRSASTSGSCVGSRSWMRKPFVVSFTWVSTGEDT